MLEFLKSSFGGGNNGGKSVESPLAAWWMATHLRMQRWLFRSFLGTTDRIQVYKQLLILLSNGISLEKSMAEMYVVMSRRDEAIDPNRDFGPQLREMLNEKPKRPAAILMQEVLRELQAGGSMSNVLGQWVTDQEHSLIRSGEKANKYVPALRKTIFALKMRGRLTKALFGSLAMPVLLFLGIYIGLFIVGFYLVPTFLQIMPIDRWTGDTRSLLDMGLFATHWAIPLIAGTVLGVGALVWSFPNLTGPIRDRLDQLPPWNIFRMFHGSVFLLNLSTLLASGTPIEDSLRIMAEKASPYIRERMKHALRGLAKGKNIGEALHLAEHRFPDDNSIGFLRVLSARAGFTEALDGSIEDWMDQNIDSIVRIANFMRFIAIGIGGWFLVTMFSGVYGLTQAAKG